MESYSHTYKLLHWLMAVLIFLMFFALQGFQPDMSDADRTTMLIGHSSIGTVITMLLIIRISKRFILKHPQPQHELLQTQAPLQATAAKITHLALYALMILVPLTGYLTANFSQLPVQLFGSIPLNGFISGDSHTSAETFTTLRLIHSTLVKALLTLVILHVSAALMHKFVLKDGVMKSMKPWIS